MAQKVYQGLAPTLDVVLPQKEVNRALSTESRHRNEEIAEDKVVVENYFGRDTQLRAILHD